MQPEPKRQPPASPAHPTAVAPTQAAWDALTPQERLEVEEALVTALDESDRASMTPEGDDHYDAKEDIRRTLRDFFSQGGHAVYVGAERGVFYPGETGFTPDILAVVGVSPHKRDSWMVAAEGRGLDVVIEVHCKGNWRKDFVDNLKKYARLGIPEYFIYDVGRQSLSAFRLPEGGGEYVPVRARRGKVLSQRLGLELGVRRGRLRFFLQGAVVSTADELIAELTEIAEQEQARAEQEQARAEQEQARAEQEQARAEQSLAGLRGALRALLVQQGRPLTAAEQVRIEQCRDPLLLQRWFERALTSAADLFLDG